MTQETFDSDFQMAYNNPSSDHNDPYQYYTGNTYGTYTSEGSAGTDESSFWSNSPRSDSPSPNSYSVTVNGTYHNFKPISCTTSSEHHQHFLGYRNGYSQITVSDLGSNNNNEVPFVRVVKRRTTANKKERRRTQSINNGYADLRDCIPNVPSDTKLSKIKTLRLAISYISYLTRALESDDPAGGFKAELATLSRRTANNQQINHFDEEQEKSSRNVTEDVNNQRKAKGRTGWPQHVWALELKQEQTI